MKRTIWMLGLAVAVATLGISTANARPSIPTKITHDATVPSSGGRSIVTGAISSPNLLCVLARPVKLTAHYPNGRTKVLDADLASVNGAWAAKGDLTGADRLKAKAVRWKVPAARGIRACQPAVVVWAVP